MLAILWRMRHAINLSLHTFYTSFLYTNPFTVSCANGRLHLDLLQLTVRLTCKSTATAIRTTWNLSPKAHACCSYRREESCVLGCSRGSGHSIEYSTTAATASTRDSVGSMYLSRRRHHNALHHLPRRPTRPYEILHGPRATTIHRSRIPK